MSLTAIKQNLVPYLRFPTFKKDWAREEVSQLCELIVDCVNKTAPTTDEETPFKMLRTPNIRDGRVSRENCKSVSREVYENWTRRAKVSKGDVILTREAPMGEVGYIDFNDTVFLGQRLMQYRSDQTKLNGKFLLFSLLSPDLQNQIRLHEGNGSTVGHIRVGDCSKFVLTLPSPPEQRKIADFLTAVDGRIGQLIQKKALLEDYKKGVLQQLFTQAIRFKDDHGNDFPDWEEKKLGEIATFSKGSGISKAEVHEDGATPCIRYGELYTLYSELIGEVKSRTNVETKSLVMSQQNDVIIPASGETHIDIATASCVMEAGIALGGDLNIIRAKTNGVFLAYYLNNAMKHTIAGMAQGSSVIHLYPAQLKLLKLSVPSLTEQTKIADFLSTIDRKIESVATQITETQTFKRGLLQQMFV